LWLHSLKVAQLLRSAACLHTNQSRSYLNHLVVLRVKEKGVLQKSACSTVTTFWRVTVCKLDLKSYFLKNGCNFETNISVTNINVYAGCSSAYSNILRCRSMSVVK